MSDSPLTEWRKALQEQLEKDLKIKFVPGLLGPGVEGTNLGSVYVAHTSEVPGRVQEEELMAQVRVYVAFEQQLDLTAPIDPTPFEELVDKLKASVKGHQTGLPGTWFQRLVSTDIDLDAQRVDAVIIARALNAGL